MAHAAPYRRLSSTPTSPLASETPSDEQRGELLPLEIIRYMEGKGFNINAHWTRFMRLLGMKADRIINYHRHVMLNPSDGQTELEDCLEDWISNDPSFSWEKIDDAVKYVKEHECAVIVFRLLGPELSQIIQDCDEIVTVVLTLKAENVIEILPITKDGKTNEDLLLQSLKMFITQKPSYNLFKLVRLLTKFHSFKKIIASFELDCELFSLREPPKENLTSVPLSPTLKGEFVEVIEEYQLLIGAIVEIIIKRENNDDIKKHIIDSRYSGDPDRLTELTKSELRSYIRHISSVINTKQLKTFLKRFGLVKEIRGIEDFEKIRYDVCTTLKADKLIGKTLSFMNIDECNKITFTVKWEVSDTDLNEIEEILSFAFEELAADIHIERIREGNSITITCYAHESIMGLLIFKAQKNLPILKEKGVILLKIGYCTLLSHKKKYEINASETEEMVTQLKEDNGEN